MQALDSHNQRGIGLGSATDKGYETGCGWFERGRLRKRSIATRIPSSQKREGKFFL